MSTFGIENSTEPNCNWENRPECVKTMEPVRQADFLLNSISPKELIVVWNHFFTKATMVKNFTVKPLALKNLTSSDWHDKLEKCNVINSLQRSYFAHRIILTAFHLNQCQFTQHQLVIMTKQQPVHRKQKKGHRGNRPLYCLFLRNSYRHYWPISQKLFRNPPSSTHQKWKSILVYAERRLRTNFSVDSCPEVVVYENPWLYEFETSTF